MNYALRDTDEWTSSLRWSPTWVGLHPIPLSDPTIQSTLALSAPTKLTTPWSNPIPASYIIDREVLLTNRNFVGLLEPLTHELALLDTQIKWVSNSFDLSFERLLPDTVQVVDYFEHPYKVEIETSTGWIELSEVFNYTNLFFSGFSSWKYDNGQLIIGGLGLKQISTETYASRSYLRYLSRNPDKPVYVVMENGRHAILHPSEIRSDGLLPMVASSVILWESINPSTVSVRINDSTITSSSIVDIIDHSYYNQLFWNTSVLQSEISIASSLLKNYVKDTSNLSVKIGIGASLGFASENVIQDGDLFPSGSKLLENRFKSLYQKVYDHLYLIENPLDYYSEDNYLLPSSGDGIDSLRTLILMQDRIRDSVYKGQPTHYAESEVNLITYENKSWKFKWQNPSVNLLGGSFE